MKNHKKQSASETLAANLKALMAADAHLGSGPKVAKASGVSRKSVNNMEEKRHDPKLSSIEAVAKSFKLEAYQLLAPGMDENLLAIYRAYRDTDDSGRNLLTAAAEAVLKARERKQSPTGTNE